MVMDKRLIAILLLIIPFLLKGQMNFFWSHSGRDTTVTLDLGYQAYKTEAESAVEFDVVSLTNSAYISLGVQYYDSYSTTVSTPDDYSDRKTFGSDSLLEARYKFLMNNSPYYSIWGGGVDNPTSGDTISIYTDLYFEDSQDVNIGIIGDNYFSVHKNGELILEVEDIGDVENFRYLNIFPVSVSSGNNRLTFTGIGDQSVSQALGVIVWDNTKEELYNDIIPKTSWNVLWHSGLTIDNIVYDCPYGYSYDETSGDCIQITSMSNWESGDDVYISMFVSENVRDDVTSWSLTYGSPDITIDSGTNYESSTIFVNPDDGAYRFTYSVVISGETYTLERIVILGDI